MRESVCDRAGQPKLTFLIEFLQAWKLKLGNDRIHISHAEMQQIEGRSVWSTLMRAVLDLLVLNPAVVIFDRSPSVLVCPDPPT